MKDWVNISQRLIMLGQLGLSLVMPLLICLGVCYLLISKAGLVPVLLPHAGAEGRGDGPGQGSARNHREGRLRRSLRVNKEEPPAFNGHK